MQISINQQLYDVIVYKKKNKNTYIRINDEMQVVITTSLYSTNSFIKQVLEENKKAIQQMIEKKKTENEKKEKFLFLGKEYQIVKISTLEKIEINDGYLYIKNEKQLDLWIKKMRKQLFEEQLDLIYHKFDEKIPYPKLKIRSMKTRWGVCNRKDNSVTLNAELLREPIECLNYVITHELSHFVHFDHSKQFWDIVEKYDPNYKQIRKYLKG